MGRGGAQQESKARAAAGGTMKLGAMGTAAQLHPKIVFSGCSQLLASVRQSSRGSEIQEPIVVLEPLELPAGVTLRCIVWGSF